MKKNIYELLLHEYTTINDPKFNDPNSFTKITRVPGGWIYEFHERVLGEKEASNSISSTFVPYSEEFKPVHQNR